MSAWIVDKSNIDQLITYIAYKIEKYAGIGQMYLYIGPDKLGQKIWKLNHDAVNQRYNEQVKCPKYEFESRKSSVFQVLKSLHCLTYQCAEGNVPRRKLYKFLTQLEHEIEYGIINKLKAYEDAKWE